MPIVSDYSEMILVSKELCKCGHLAENHYYHPASNFALIAPSMKAAHRRNAYQQCMMQDPKNPCTCKKFESMEGK